jgi:hypothetical protein
MSDCAKCGLLSEAALVATVLGMACVTHRAATQPAKSLAQCYKLDIRTCEWSMPIPDYWLKRSADEAFPRRVPTIIRLEASEPPKDQYDARWNIRTGAIRPCSASEFDPLYKFGTWRRQSEGPVQLVWSTGMSGVILEVPTLGSSMRGTIKSFSDAMGNPMPVCEIRLRRKTCKCP